MSIRSERKSTRCGSNSVVGDYYYVYAWDVVDIFFATAVASVPALNMLADGFFSALVSFTTGSKASGSSKENILKIIRSFGSSQRHGTTTSDSTANANSKYSKQSSESFHPIILRRTDFELKSITTNEGNSQDAFDGSLDLPVLDRVVVGGKSSLSNTCLSHV